MHAKPTIALYAIRPAEDSNATEIRCSVGSRFCCSRSSPDILPTNQTIQVLILNVSASKFIEILEESLPLNLVHFFTAAIRTLTGKVYQLLFSSFLAFVSSVTLSLVLLELPFLSFPIIFVSQSLSPAPRLLCSRGRAGHVIVCDVT